MSLLTSSVAQCSEDTGKKELRLQIKKIAYKHISEEYVFLFGCPNQMNMARTNWTLSGFGMYLVFLGKIFLSVPCWQFPIKFSNQMRFVFFQLF